MSTSFPQQSKEALRLFPVLSKSCAIFSALLLGVGGVIPSADAQIYVTEPGSSSVTRFGKNGAAYPGNSIISGIAVPTGIAVDLSGNVYVASYGSSSVGFYNGSTGVFDDSFITGLMAPYAVAVDLAGNVYVAESGRNSVGKYTPGIGYDADFITSVSQASSIALDAAGNVYIGATSHNFIAKYDTNGDLDPYFILNPNGASSLAVSGNSLYSIGNGAVGKFSLLDGGGDEEFITGLGASYGIAADAGGDLFVANYGGGTVSIYDGADGSLKGVPITGLASPYFLAVAVPEPGVVSLLVLGAGGLLVLARRNRRGGGGFRN